MSLCLPKPALIAGACLAFLPASQAADSGFSTLLVGDEEVRTYRDEYGVPHIFAESDRGLFEGYGYAIAQDRLWQLEVNRRARRGRLAEILGASSLAADRVARQQGLTDAELDARFAGLSAEAREIVEAYVAGINRYIVERVAPDPALLPYEFKLLGIAATAIVPWEVRDVVAFTSAFAQDPLGGGGGELPNQSLLAVLQALHGPQDGLAIFDDLRWRNDPDAPVTIPGEDAIGHVQRSRPDPAQMPGAGARAEDDDEAQAQAILEALGVPLKLGSHAWAISPARSATGEAMLFGGPQLGFNMPEVLHEVQLHGGNGFNVGGAAVSGIPAVVVGRTDHIAWTITAAAAVDNSDTYIETLCAGGTGYMYNGSCTPFAGWTETIAVRNAAPAQVRVMRSVHGPVVTPSTANLNGTCTTASAPGVCFTRKRVFASGGLRELEAFLALNRARNPNEFEAALGGVVAGRNFLYADRVGNIAYWQAGLVPVRAAGFDPRLPLPGDGRAEWTGEFLPMPKSINPARGWLANWNNKPVASWDNPDHVTFGKLARVREIEARLDSIGLVSAQDMRDIPTYIARTVQGGDGRISMLLLPYLLNALSVVPPAHPLASEALATLRAWDGSRFADVLTSTTLEPGDVVFRKWRDLMLAATFTPALGANVGQANSNVLLHLLDARLGTGSGVPPNFDYFAGRDPNALISAAFDEALAALGDESAWSSVARESTVFRHALFPQIPDAATMLESNKGTYAQLTVLGSTRGYAENIVSLGQSGFIGGSPPSPVFDAHFRDQFPLYSRFEYKPLRFYRNAQLQE
jgi:penicillin amidase